MFCWSGLEGEEILLEVDGLPQPISVKVLHVGKRRVKLGLTSAGTTKVIRLAVENKKVDKVPSA